MQLVWPLQVRCNRSKGFRLTNLLHAVVVCIYKSGGMTSDHEATGFQAHALGNKYKCQSAVCTCFPVNTSHRYRQQLVQFTPNAKVNPAVR